MITSPSCSCPFTQYSLSFLHHYGRQLKKNGKLRHHVKTNLQVSFRMRNLQKTDDQQFEKMFSGLIVQPLFYTQPIFIVTREHEPGLIQRSAEKPRKDALSP
ncbi:integrin beta-3 [Platysternon megacephalum]|uniref:Integrin beta-3 n=1 Tax=Platysternon megacephalum TaxID=55544 RepID=A0A4D9EVX4_9SAUR|nr:integrin beta-3 [Platysternon megacephalum]